VIQGQAGGRWQEQEAISDLGFRNSDFVGLQIGFGNETENFELTKSEFRNPKSEITLYRSSIGT
jgi:hypothetical protein